MPAERDCNWAQIAGETVDLMLVVTDPAYRILWVNSAAERAFGPARGLVGRYCYEAIEGRDDVCPHCVVAKSHVSGLPAKGEIQEVDGTGQTHYYHVHAFPISGDNGQIIAWLEATTSFTSKRLLQLEAERLKARLRMHETESRFASLVDTAPVGIGISVERQIAWANPNFADIFGYLPEEIIGLNTLGFVASHMRKKVLAGFDAILEDGRTRGPNDIEVIDAHGNTRLIATTSTSCVYQGQSAVMSVIQDVTEDRRIRADMERKNAELAAFNSIAKALGCSLDMSKVLDVTLQHMMRFARADIGAIALIDRDQTTVKLAAHQGTPANLFGHTDELPIDPRWRKTVCEKGEVLHITNTPEDRSRFPEVPAAGLSCGLVAPLRSRDRLVGVLGLISTQKLDFHDVPDEFLLSIGTQIGMAIANAQLYEEKADSEQLYRALFNTVPDPIVLISVDDQRLLNFNRPFCEQLGYAREELTGMFLADIVTPKDYAFCSRVFSDFINGRHGPAQYHVRCRRKAGDVRLMDAHVSPYIVEGRVVGLQVVARDITGQKQLQEHMLRAEKLSALGQLVSGVAHELNNPLATILLAAELLWKSETEPDKKGKLEAIIEQVKRSNALTEDLRLFARREKPQREPIHLRNTISKVCSLVSPTFRRENIDIDIEIPEDMPLVLGDEHQLEQIFLNLANNALQAMEKLPRKHALTIAAHPNAHSVVSPGSCVNVVFSDTGAGICADVKHRIFDPFFTTKAPGKGTGIGLSVSLSIAERHGGTIYTRDSDRGAVFVVELPICTETATATQRVQVEGPPVFDISGMQALIVDDERSIVEMLSYMFEGTQCNVDKAYSTQEAISHIEVYEYDLVLCAMQMPNLDGRACFRAIQHVRPDLAQRVIFMSGDVATTKAYEFFQTIPNPTLEKPFTYAELVDAIRQVQVLHT